MAAGLPSKILFHLSSKRDYHQASIKVIFVGLGIITIISCIFPTASSAMPRKLSEQELSSMIVQIVPPIKVKLVYVESAGENKYYYKYDDNIYFPAEVEKDPDIEMAINHFFVNEDGLRCLYNSITGQTILCEKSVLTYKSITSSYRVCGRGPSNNLGIFIGPTDVGCINVDYSSSQPNLPWRGKIITQEVEPQYPPAPIGRYALRTQTIDAETNIDSFSARIRYGNDDLGVIYVQGMHARMNSDIIVETYNEPKKYFGFFIGWQNTK